MKIAVYTCITNGKDKLKPMPKEEGVDYFCFTDSELESDTWKIMPLVRDFENNPRKTARWHKTHSHKLFDTYDYTIWIDGSLHLNKTPTELVKTIGNNDLGVRVHPAWNSVVTEGQKMP